MSFSENVDQNNKFQLNEIQNQCKLMMECLQIIFLLSLCLIHRLGICGVFTRDKMLKQRCLLKFWEIQVQLRSEVIQQFKSQYMIRQSPQKKSKENPQKFDLKLKTKRSSKQQKMKQRFSYNDDEAKAKKHRQAYRLGAKKLKHQDSRCQCCDQYKVEEEHPLCCPPYCSIFPQPQEIQEKDGKISHMYLYFTFVKGIIMFLALRFLFFDLTVMYQSVQGSYCSELFRTKSEVCTYTLSAYNLKGEAEHLHNDQLNAFFTLLSIIYFSRLKATIISGKKAYQVEKMNQNSFSLLVTNIPSLTYQNSKYNELFFTLQEQVNKEISGCKHLHQISTLIEKKYYSIKGQRPRKNDGQNCAAQVRRLFVSHLKKIFVQKGGVDLIDQQYYLARNSEQRFLTRKKKYIRKLKRLFRYRYHQTIEKEKDIDQCLKNVKNGQQPQLSKYKESKIRNLSLLDYININIVTVITLCYDINELNRINNIRNNAQSYALRGQLKDNQKQQLIGEIVQKCHNIESDLSIDFESRWQEMFHTSHFLGKAIVSFELKLFRDLIIQSYESDPNSFAINGNVIMIEPAPKPSDIIWQNLSQNQQIKQKYNQHSWIVMIMMLVISFAAFTCLQLLSKNFQVAHAEEKSFQKFKRVSYSLLSALITSLINMFLAYQINVLVEMERHITRIGRQRSLIVKSILAQSFNTIAIYIIIYLINPTNPLGQYGLAEKAISLAIISNLTTVFLQVVRPTSLWSDIQNINIFSSKPKQKTFQIKLNKEYEYPKFDQEDMYVSYTLMLFLVSFYGYLVPVTTPIVFGFFILLYWIDKYNAFKRSSLDSFDDNKGDLILGMIQISILISAASYFWWDLSLQKVPTLKLLNLASIFFAAQFVGFQVLNSKQVIQRIFHDQQKKSKCKSSYYMLTFDKNYKEQSHATKTYEFGKKKNGQKQTQHQKHVKPFTGYTIQMVKQINKFLNFMQVDESIQGAKVKCSLCQKQVNEKNIIQNISCHHNSCVSCFWNNIYYQIETLSEIKCIYCNNNIDKTLCFPQLQQRLQQRVTSYLQQKKHQQQKRICLACYQSGEFSYYDKKIRKCPKCLAEYCKQKFCKLLEHKGKTCREAYEQILRWKKCNLCHLMVQPTNKCTHMPGNWLQAECPICIFGWSDIYNHPCNTVRLDARQIKNRPYFMHSSFVKFLIGLYELLIVLASLVLLMGVYVLALVACVAVSPVFLVYLVVTRLIMKCEWILILQLTIFLPITMLAYFRELNEKFFSYAFETTNFKQIQNWLPTYIIEINNYFYEYQPYKQYMSNYTHMKVSGSRRKFCYFLLMLGQIPILFPLAMVYFITSTLVVLCFMLIFLPYIISKERRVSIWVPILFYPVMLIYYFAPVYFGNLIFHQFVDLVTFYFHYTKSMFGYLIDSCGDGQDESTSVYDQNREKKTSE